MSEIFGLPWWLVVVWLCISLVLFILCTETAHHEARQDNETVPMWYAPVFLVLSIVSVPFLVVFCLASAVGGTIGEALDSF